MYSDIIIFPQMYPQRTTKELTLFLVFALGSNSMYSITHSPLVTPMCELSSLPPASI